MSFDLGGSLSQYQQGNTQPLIGELNTLNLPLTQQSTEFLGDVQDMSIASGRTGLLSGWKLPAGADSRNDFFALMTDGEQFAAASGWQFFPTPQQMQWGVEHGVAQLPQQQVWSWMAGLNPKGTASMPWLNAGMNHQQWDQYNSRLVDVWQQYTGTTAAPAAILQQAATQNWSAQRFQQWLTQDPTTLQHFGWVQHGMTFNDFQQFKLNNKQQATARFGSNAGDSQFLTMLAQPLGSANMQGAVVQQPQQGQTGASGFGYGRASA